MSTKNETKEIKKSAETSKGTSSLPGAMPSIWYKPPKSRKRKLPAFLVQDHWDRFLHNNVKTN